MRPRGRDRTVSYSEVEKGGQHRFDSLRNAAMESLIKTLNDYRRTSHLCDFNIKIDGVRFPVHKNVLSASSPFFAALFQVDEERFIENEQNSIELQGITPEIGEKIITYLYTTDIELDPDNVQEIAKAASMYQLSNLFDLCLEYMFSNIDTVNAIGLLCFAEYYASNGYKIRIKRYVEQNFSEICTGEEFSMLPESILKSFLRSEDLSIFSEDEVLVATLNWFAHDEVKRMKFFPEFIGYLRMPLVSSNEIQKIRNSFSNTNILRQFEELLEPKPISDQNGDKDGDKPSFENTPYFQIRFQPRFCVRKRLFVIDGYTHERGMELYGSIEMKIIILDMSMDNCKIVRGPSLLKRTSNAGSAMLGDHLYIAGGGTLQENYKTFMRLNVRDQNGAWERLPSMQFKRNHCSLISHKKKLYAIGGFQDGNFLNNIEVYDPETLEWRFWDSLPTYATDYSTVKIGNFLYFVPFYHQMRSISLDFYRYDIDNKRSEKLPFWNSERLRDQFVAVALQDSIYVIGGNDIHGQATKFVNVYDIRERTWHKATSMKVPCGSVKAFVCNNLIYVLNAHGRKHRTKVEVYDPTTNCWFHKNWFKNANAINFECSTMTISD